MEVIDENGLRDILKVQDNGLLYRRESQTLEYKEQFNFAGFSKDYGKHFAGFANNKGGIIIFGIKDSPREPIGLNNSSIERLETLDSEKVETQLLEDFSPRINWEFQMFNIDGKTYGVFQVQESLYKPIMARRNGESIKEGDIYYRYSGQTKVIKFAELESILKERIEKNNEAWVKRVTEIGSSGPNDSAVLTSDTQGIGADKEQVLIVDEKLIKEINFIREGQFDEKYGSKTLKLVGEVIPARTYQVKADLMKAYPYSATELARSIMEEEPSIKITDIWECIKVNKLKSNLKYSHYVFTSKSKQDEYNNSGKLPASIASIYNENARKFLINKLKEKTNE